MEWISIKDKPPRARCLLFSEKYGMHVGTWYDEMERYNVGGFEVCNYCGGTSVLELKDISYWAYLPAPPEWPFDTNLEQEKHDTNL